jgi:hypothetical protein
MTNKSPAPIDSAKVEDTGEPVAWAATSEDGNVEALGFNQSRRFDTPLCFAAPTIPVTADDGVPVPWENLTCYLIDKCEGKVISEEFLQHALTAMLADPQYNGAKPFSLSQEFISNAVDGPDVMGFCADDGESVRPVAWRVRGYAQFKTGKPSEWRYFDGAARPTVNDPACCDIEPLGVVAAPTPSTQAVGEPVAWAATDEDGKVEALGFNQSRRFDTPLHFAAPPVNAQAPMTDARVLEIVDECFGQRLYNVDNADWIKFGRAILANGATK